MRLLFFGLASALEGFAKTENADDTAGPIPFFAAASLGFLISRLDLCFRSVDRILNHARTDVTWKHYMFAGMDGMVRQALQSWADHVEGLVLVRVAEGKVVPFQRTTA